MQEKAWVQHLLWSTPFQPIISIGKIVQFVKLQTLQSCINIDKKRTLLKRKLADNESNLGLGPTFPAGKSAT